MLGEEHQGRRRMWVKVSDSEGSGRVTAGKFLMDQAHFLCRGVITVIVEQVDEVAHVFELCVVVKRLDDDVQILDSLPNHAKYHMQTNKNNFIQISNFQMVQIASRF